MLKIQLEGFADVAEAREAAKTFLRETRPKKGSGPRRTYASSYELTRAQSSANPKPSRRHWLPFGKN